MEHLPPAEHFPDRSDILGRFRDLLPPDDLIYLADPEQVPDDVFIMGLYGTLVQLEIEDPDALLRERGVFE